MRLGVTVASVLLLGSFAAAGAGAVSKPAITVVRGQHLIVRGSHFAPRERVRVRLVADSTLTRRPFTTRLGRFTADFGAITISRCDAFEVVAVGTSRDRAVLKVLPPPACSTG